MPHTSPPAASDVKTLIAGTSLFPSLDVAPFTAIDFDGAASAAYDQFRAATGREFIVNEPTTRAYDPPRHPKGILMLGGDLASDPAATIAVTISGVAKVANQDYYLGPENADQKGKPWGWIEIPAMAITFVNGNPRKSIAITGYWGYSREMPDNVFDAIVKKAAVIVAPQLALKVSGGAQSVSDEKQQVIFGRGPDTPFSSQVDLWTRQVSEAETNMKRVISV